MVCAELQIGPQHRVRRFDPDRDSAPHWEEYRIARAPGMTVLDGLWRVKETQAPELAWRSFALSLLADELADE